MLLQEVFNFLNSHNFLFLENYLIELYHISPYAQRGVPVLFVTLFGHLVTIIRRSAQFVAD